MTTKSRSELTDRLLVESLGSKICPACGGIKKYKQTFCSNFCSKADQWHKAMAAMSAALRPFVDRLNALEDQASKALQYGGYEPVEEDGESTVPNKLLFDARTAFQRTPQKHAHQFNEEMRAARLAVEALKNIAYGGSIYDCKRIAERALNEVRKVDPHI